MTVAAGVKGRVFRLASRVVLHGHAGPMVDRVAQANVGGLAHEHDAALAGSLGDRSELMVNQIAINHSISIRVGEDWLSKNLGCMQGWGGCETDLRSVEIF